MRHWMGWNDNYTALTVPYGTFDKREAWPVVDSLTGQTMLVKVNLRTGVATNKRALRKRMMKCPDGIVRQVYIREAEFTEDQYALMRWCFGKIDEGWSVREVFQIINQFWELMPGQTPLHLGMISHWKKVRTYMNRKGLIWP